MLSSKIMIIMLMSMMVIVLAVVDKDGNEVVPSKNSTSKEISKSSSTSSLHKSTSETGLEVDDKAQPGNRLSRFLGQSFTFSKKPKKTEEEEEIIDDPVDEETKLIVTTSQFVALAAFELGYTPTFYESMKFTAMAETKRLVGESEYFVKGTVQTNFENDENKISVMDFGVFTKETAGNVTLGKIHHVSGDPMFLAGFDLLFQLFENQMVTKAEEKEWKVWALRVPRGFFLKKEVNANLLQCLPSLDDKEAGNKNNWNIAKYKAKPINESLLHCLLFTSDEEEETAFAYAAYLITSKDMMVVESFLKLEVRHGPA